MTVDIDPVGELSGGTGSTVAVGPDGIVTVAASTGMATLWREDELVDSIDLDEYVDGPIVFSSDGRTARVGTWLVDVESAKATATTVDVDLLLSGLDHARRTATRFYSARAAASTVDGTRMIASFVYAPSRGIGDDEPNPGPAGQIVLIDPASGAFVAVLQDVANRYHRPVVAIDDRHAVAATAGIAAWATSDGSPAGRDDTDDVLRSDVRLSPDGRYVAATRFDGTAEVRSFADFATAAVWTAHSARATALAFHPSRPIIATGGDDEQVKLWSFDDPSAPELVGWYYVEQEVGALAFHPLGEHLLIAAEREVVVTALSGL